MIKSLPSLEGSLFSSAFASNPAIADRPFQGITELRPNTAITTLVDLTLVLAHEALSRQRRL
jgi:hypothetical protein